MKAMTDEQYVATGGNTCPLCGSDNIEAGHAESDAGYAWHAVECHACENTWLDVYRLIGYTVTEA